MASDTLLVLYERLEDGGSRRVLMTDDPGVLAAFWSAVKRAGVAPSRPELSLTRSDP